MGEKSSLCYTYTHISTIGSCDNFMYHLIRLWYPAVGSDASLDVSVSIFSR